MFLLFSPTPAPDASPTADPSLTPIPTPVVTLTPTPTPTPTSPEEMVLPDPETLTNTVLATCSGNDDVICPLVEGVLPKGWAPFAAWLITIILILLGALVLRNLVRRLIDRITRRAAMGVLPERLRGRAEHMDTAQALLTERRRQRAETMGSVLRYIASIVIMGTALLMILARFGMNLAPLLTSVGILGVAVGFGAQELVKDFISGMFMLLEDQYGVGDIIDTGTATGTVEAVTLRITRLRDFDGKVWYIRNGTITRVGNESQGWSRALVDVPVPYDADIDEIRELLKDIATGLWEEPDQHDLVIVEEPRVYAVEQISDSALIFRVTAKTVPGQQAQVARELRVRIKRALDERGIAFAATP
ncbi:mechanosensitive ion channel family protein [Thermopolyspora sp. NPDC052614]|uniref:mechanosensitive ion channel family protein n=1 Tax=Thermopolyspora sp. NPDC052614 TaxID=3155682 RepID=UPI00343D6263